MYLMFANAEQVAHRQHLRALMGALLQEVIYPFRWRVLVIIVMQIAAQALLLASLLLPWQLLQVLMTGQSRLTNGLPARFGDNDKIAMLLALAVLCFCAFALLQWLIKRCISRFFDTLLKTLNKTRLVANHRALGRRVLTIVLGALSSACIALLFCLVIGSLHLVLGLLAAACVATLVGIVVRHYRFEKVPQIQEKLQSNVLTVINVSFALGFGILVIDYIYGSVRPLFTLFILLIALRQMMAASVNGIVNVLGIIKHFQHINMLLLPRPRQVFIEEATDFLQCFEAARLAQWLPGWLAERHHGVFEIVECRLLHGRTVSHVLLRAQHGSAPPAYWLLKCYVPARENEAHHEVALLEEHHMTACAVQPEVPRLLEHGGLLWCRYVVLNVGSQRPQWLNSEERKPWMAPLRKALLQLPVSQGLVMQYRATFASLPERMRSIDTAWFDYLTHEDREAFQVARFKECWPHIIALVEKVPQCLTIHNPASARLALVDNKQLLLLDWHGWAHDTLGSYWPLSAKLASEVQTLLAAQWPMLCACPRWAELQTPDVAAHHVALAARAHEFCHRCRASNDAGALNMLPGILKAQEALLTATGHDVSYAAK